MSSSLRINGLTVIFWFDPDGHSMCHSQRGAIPTPQDSAHEEIRRKSANYQIIGKPGDTWAPVFEQLAQAVADAPPVRPKPLTQDGLLGLFKGDTVGRNIVLQPATQEDMCGTTVVEKPSLEVVYEAI